MTRWGNQARSCSFAVAPKAKVLTGCCMTLSPTQIAKSPDHGDILCCVPILPDHQIVLQSASPLAQHQMSVTSAKSTPGRWILEGASAPTPPHLQVGIHPLLLLKIAACCCSRFFGNRAICSTPNVGRPKLCMGFRALMEAQMTASRP